MQQVPGNFPYTGSIRGVSMYKMRGSDKIIVRTKGGPTKKQVKHSPKFDLTRRNNREFGGRARMAQRVRRILSPLQFLADHNFTGPLNALAKHIQSLDTVNEYGQRAVLLSRQPEMLVGFNLNNRFLFDSIIRTPVNYNLSKDNLQATIRIPSLTPGINFSPAGVHPWYQIIAVLGIVPDLVYTPHGYLPAGGHEDFSPEYAKTDWLEVNTGSTAIDLHLAIPSAPKTTGYSCMLAIGVAMGNMQHGKISEVKYIGGAKVLAVQ